MDQVNLLSVCLFPTQMETLPGHLLLLSFDEIYPLTIYTLLLKNIKSLSLLEEN
jgi:hypothetical protein